MKKINLALLIGGPSSENEISHLSARSILNNLDKNKYNIFPVVASKKLDWTFFDSADHYLNNPRKVGKLTTGDFLNKLQELDIDVAFIAMHGTFGEDGTIQSLLDSIRIPYNGSNSSASALAIDKIRSAELFSYHGIDVAPFIAFTKRDWQEKQTLIDRDIDNKLSSPFLVVKPTNLGSSVATFIVNSQRQLRNSIEEALSYSELIMVQEYIKGKEITCGIMDFNDSSKINPLPPTQIIPRKSDFFDFKSKYTKDASEEITPADIDKKLIKKAQLTATKCHQIIGCEGITRTDIIICDKKLYVLEINTLPGMTETSLIPKQAKAIGIDMPSLLDRIIKHSLKFNKL